MRFTSEINGMETPGNEMPQTSDLSPPVRWLHTTPTQMPWGVLQPSFVRFSGEKKLDGIDRDAGGSYYMPQACMSHVPSSVTQTRPRFSNTRLNSLLSTQCMSSSQSAYVPQLGLKSLKRKIDPADDEMLCAVNKLHISEDTMVVHHQGVHALTQLASDAVHNIKEIPEGRRLVISEEIQQFPLEGEPLLPKPLLDRMRRPSNALVLWQPPRPLTSALPQEEEDVDNNNSSTLDLNNLPSFSDNEAQPIDESDIDMEAL